MQACQVCLLEEVSHAECRTIKPLRIGDCCQGEAAANHSPVCDVLTHSRTHLKDIQKCKRIFYWPINCKCNKGRGSVWMTLGR